MESRKRTKISDKQTASLELFYGRGMVGIGVSYRELIDAAVAETGLTTSQVKKWIGNQKRKRPANHMDECNENEQEAQLKKAKSIRGPNAYNVFCSEFFKSERCKDLECEEKNKLASAAWKQMGDNEKKSFKSSADAMKNVKINLLSDEQKGKLIARHKKKLLEEILILEDLGCIVTTILQDNAGTIFELGSEHGNMFLASYPDVVVKFRECFLNYSHEYGVNDVQKLFNKKYSEAVGKPSKVPYLKGGFKVEGLPDGIPFRKPYHYGALQCKKIISVAKDLKFVLNTESLDDETSTPNSVKETITMEAVKQLLSKIAGTQAAENAINSSTKKIEEEDVEVINLLLTEEERILLYSSCKDFFTGDAWLAVGKNMKHCDEIKKIILPIYTEADERFWLFHTVAKPSFIQKCGPFAKIKGQWLDLKPSGDYDMLSEQLYLLGKNVIHTCHGPLYFITDNNFHQASSYNLSVDCRNAINNALELIG